MMAPVLVSGLQLILDAVASDTMPREDQQGKSPCIRMMTSHTPVSLLTWTSIDGRPEQLRYDWGCNEPSGVVESAVRLASIAARFNVVPIVALGTLPNGALQQSGDLRMARLARFY